MVLISSSDVKATGSKVETVTVSSSITELTSLQFLVTGLQECYYRYEYSPGANLVFFHRCVIATGIFFKINIHMSCNNSTDLRSPHTIFCSPVLLWLQNNLQRYLLTSIKTYLMNIVTYLGSSENEATENSQQTFWDCPFFLLLLLGLDLPCALIPC